MNQIANMITQGLFLASIFALVSVGFVVLYRATGVVSFVQGYLMLLGAVVYHYISDSRPTWMLYVGLPLTLVVVGVVAVLAYRLVFARLTGADAFVSSIASIGLGMLLQLVIIMVFGSVPVSAPRLVSNSYWHVTGTVNIPWTTIFLLGGAVVSFACILLYLFATPVGLAMRAAANRTLLAAQAGVNVRSVSAVAWGIGGVTAALAGIGYSFSAQIDPNTIPNLGLLVFPVLILGGLDSLKGAIIASIILGLIESATITWIGGQEQDIISYALMLGVILFKPSGLFGSREVARL
ncbi:branched-chain amino acid ABC transporter permease [Dactylosporangium sp. CA-092794]|uniref:branched-chain amino acid ABC transporter permease n=1 Tax=Dactylosporangium sp. CA-092794 TaxID=3239929 RepID=UPI003D934B80